MIWPSLFLGMADGMRDAKTASGSSEMKQPNRGKAKQQLGRLSASTRESKTNAQDRGRSFDLIVIKVPSNTHDRATVFLMATVGEWRELREKWNGNGSSTEES